MNRQENTKNMIIVFAAGTIAVIWLALMAAQSYYDGVKLFEFVERLMDSINQPFNMVFTEYSLKFTGAAIVMYAMGVGIYFTSRENRRPGEEHGSAKWGNVKSVAKKYEDKKDKSNNLILSQSLRLGLNAKKHRRNLNVLIVGGSGAGKTRFYAKPSASVRAA